MIYMRDCETLLKEMFGENGWVRGDKLPYGQRKIFLKACSDRFDMDGLTEGALWTRLKKAKVVKPSYSYKQQRFTDNTPTRIEEWKQGGTPAGEEIQTPVQVPVHDPPQNSSTSAIELSLARIELLLKSLLELWQTEG